MSPSWWVDIIPGLGEGNLELELGVTNCAALILNTKNAQACDGRLIRSMRCPASPTPELIKVSPLNPNSTTVCSPSYVGIAGSTNEDGLTNTPVQANINGGELSGGGVFVPNQPLRISNITDGTSHTMCVGEMSAYSIDLNGKEADTTGGARHGLVY